MAERDNFTPGQPGPAFDEDSITSHSNEGPISRIFDHLSRIASQDYSVTEEDSFRVLEDLSALSQCKPDVAMGLYLSAASLLADRGPDYEPLEFQLLSDAWSLALDGSQRGLAEYIFEAIEPFLSTQEMERMSESLQSLALSRLNDIGLDETYLDEVASMISQEIQAVSEAVSNNESPESLLERINRVAAANGGRVVNSALVQVSPSPEGPVVESRVLSSADSHSLINVAEPPQTQVVAGQIIPETDQGEGEAIQDSVEKPQAGSVPVMPDSATPEITTQEIATPESPKTQRAKSDPKHRSDSRSQRFTFSDLVGYDSVIEEMRTLGIGYSDPSYRHLRQVLCQRHGLEGLSSQGSIVLRTSSREDASTFMNAVVGELDLPAIKVNMQNGPVGSPILCLSMSAMKVPPKPQAKGFSFDFPCVLILEDFDMWGGYLVEAASGHVEASGEMGAMQTRSSREAIAAINAAVNNPESYVLVSMSAATPDQGFLFDLIEPMHVIDLFLPTEEERLDIWNELCKVHPSLMALDLDKLVNMTRNLARFDIVTAARECVEDAYRQGLREGRYVPVSEAMMFEHIANFQPLESEEYRMLEDVAVSALRLELDTINLDELYGLGGPREGGN